MAKIIRADVAGQVDVTTFSGKIIRAQANVAVLTRDTGCSVLAGIGVAQVNLGVAGVASLHPGKSYWAGARVVLDGVHRSEHERFGLESSFLVAKLEDRAALFEVEAGLANADVVVEGEKFEEKQFLEEIFVKEDALLDVGRVEVVLIMGAGHRGREGDIQNLDVALNIVGLDAENLNLVFVARNDNGESFDQVLVKRRQKCFCRHICESQRHGVFEHLLCDVVQSKAEVCSSLVFAVADGDADFCFDVDVRF